MNEYQNSARLEQTRHDVVGRLHRVEGQVRGITGMVAQDRHCIDVLTQIAAASRALQSVALTLLDDHIRRCLMDPGSRAPDSMVNEASRAIARLAADPGRCGMPTSVAPGPELARRTHASSADARRSRFDALTSWAFLTPVFALGLGWWLLGERPAGWAASGGGQR